MRFIDTETLILTEGAVEITKINMRFYPTPGKREKS